MKVFLKSPASVHNPGELKLTSDPSSVTAVAGGVQGVLLENKKKYYYYYGDYYFLNKNFLWECGKAGGNFPSAKVAFIKLLSRYHKTFIN